MKIQTPPGMRDFYPEEMRVQRFLFDAWRDVSLAFGFSEYEGPIFEFLDLYRLKSGEGIVSELFSFRDRGDREFAIRPEMTPTLARMVAARANALPRPIKWFSVPRMCRAERPQRGRLREFFQWNIDVLGVDEPIADAEVIAVAAAFFRKVGLGPEDVVIRVSSRPLAAALLTGMGIAPERIEAAFGLVDRHDRIQPAEFAQRWTADVSDAVAPEAVTELLGGTTLESALASAGAAGDAGAHAAAQVREVWELLASFGVADYCAFDLKVVRGLAYYTGTVFEADSRNGAWRGLMGGGRYDDLTGLLGGAKVGGVGYGMGDVRVIEMLRDLGRAPQPNEQLDAFVVDADAALFAQVLRVAGALREAGIRVDFSYKRGALGKQMKQASARGARSVIIVGAEFAERGALTVKALATGEQREFGYDQLMRSPRECLGAAAG